MAIRFTTPVLTRAVVDGSSLPSGSSFLVWGFRTAVGENVSMIDFDGETVTENNGTWSYTGGIRYWIPGYTYKFYALYPTNIGPVSSYDNNGMLTIIGFNCSKTGEEAIDLMTASSTGINYIGDETPQPVSLKFIHKLAKIQFVAKSEGGNATVDSIELSGISTSGNYVESENPIWNDLQEGIISVKKTTTVTTSENTDVSGDLLLIPQMLEKPVITVTYSTEVEKNKKVTYSLPVDVITQWSAAQAYRYTFTITGGGYIIFDVPTVNPWNEASGGNVIIDVTQQSDT